MIDDFAKSYLREDLQWVRQSVVDQLDGLSEYDIGRPLTTTGTNLLGLIKHLTLAEAATWATSTVVMALTESPQSRSAKLATW